MKTLSLFAVNKEDGVGGWYVVAENMIEAIKTTNESHNEVLSISLVSCDVLVSKYKSYFGDKR